MKTILLLVALLPGCLAQVEAPDPVDPPACAEPVACAFDTGSCRADQGMTFSGTTRFDISSGCWVRSVACFPTGTPRECIPADCYEETSFDCGS